MSRYRTHPPKLRSLLLLVLALGLLQGAMAQSAGSPLENRPEIRARLQFARVGGVFDPAYWLYTSDWFVYPNLFNWLVRWVPGSGGYQVEPDLAESWTVSEDGRTYTFYLRRGVQFHRGYGELTAEDVVFSYTRQMEDDTASFNSNLSEVASIVAIDDYTVELTLEEPNAAFMAAVVAWRPGLIVSKRAVEELGAEFRARPIGTGPFYLEEITATEEVVLLSHDDYFRGAPQISKLTFVHVGEESIALAALRSGELDIIWSRGNPEIAAALLQDPNITAERIVRFDSIQQVMFSPNFEITQDVLVRRALAHAIDTEAIGAAFAGLDEPTRVLLGQDPVGEVPMYEYDPQLARALLAEAGYPNGFPVSMMFQTREPEATLAAIVAANWQEIGLDVRMEGMDATSTFDRRNSFDFEVTISSVGRPADLDLLLSDLFLSTSLPPGGQNYFRYAVDEVDDLLLAARRTTDPDARNELYHQVHVRVMTDLPIIPLSYQVFMAAWRDPVVTMETGRNNNFWGETIEIVDR